MISVLTAVDHVQALLATVPLVKGYPDGVIPQNDPPEPASASDPRVKCYWVLYMGPGGTETPYLDAAPYLRSLTFQVTVAAGTQDRVLFGVDQIRNKLAGAVTASGLITEQPFDPGTIRRDDNVVPPRHYVPMQFRLEP